MQQYPQGYPAQPMPMPQQGFTPPSGQPQQLGGQQEVKFYKSGLFSSAPGRFQRDCQRMQSQGWRIISVAFLGINVFLQRVIVVVYER